MSVVGPDCVKTRMLRFAGAAGWLMKPSLCSDRFYQSANAENAHDPFHVVGQDVYSRSHESDCEGLRVSLRVIGSGCAVSDI